MGFILLTFTGTSLTLILHPLHMSTLYRCNRRNKKLKNPILRPETSLRQNKAPVSDKLQQCRKKVYAGGFPVRIPGTVETTTEQNGRCQPQPNLINLSCTQPHGAVVHEDANVVFSDFIQLNIKKTGS